MFPVRLFLAASLLLSSGCALCRLSKDVEAIKRTAMLSGYVFSRDVTGSIYAVHLAGVVPTQFQKLPPSGGLFAFLVEPDQRAAVLIFADRNENGTLDDDEPFHVTESCEILAPREQRSLPVVELGARAFVKFDGALKLSSIRENKSLPVAHGAVVKLSDERFSEENAAIGMWQPLHSAKKNGFGVYFLAPHSERKTPVVFIHGMSGTPRDFSEILGKLSEHEEAWLVHYPSGIRLPIVARLLADTLEALRQKHQISHIRIVGHSVGGLVARAAVLELASRGLTNLVKEFVSIAAPFGGIGTAESGVQNLTNSVPSWTDLIPHSDFQASLRRKLPTVKFRVFSAVGGTRSTFVGGNNDGSVTIASQQPEWVLEEASQVLSFDVGHVDILKHPSVVSAVLGSK